MEVLPRPFNNLLVATTMAAVALTGCEHAVEANHPEVEASVSPTATPSEVATAPTPVPKPKPEDPAVALQRNLNTLLVPLGMPELELDSKQGPQTKRAECAVRLFTGHKASKKDATKSEMSEWAHKQSLKTPLAGFVISKTCQVMGVNIDGQLKMIIPVSTGKPNHETPSGSYSLYAALKGWHNSTTHPDKSWRKANMLDPLYFSGSYAVHGSQYMSADGTTPRSSGCVRVSLEDAPTLYELAHDATTHRLRHIAVTVLE